MGVFHNIFVGKVVKEVEAKSIEHETLQQRYIALLNEFLPPE